MISYSRIPFITQVHVAWIAIWFNGKHLRQKASSPMDTLKVLKKFVETVNGRDGTGSHLVTIPPGPHLSDALVSSAIMQVRIQKP